MPQPCSHLPLLIAFTETAQQSGKAKPKVGEASSKTSINGRRVFAAARMAAEILILGGGSEVGAAKTICGGAGTNKCLAKRKKYRRGAKRLRTGADQE